MDNLTINDMETKTISYLNGKVWYRFLKVIFIVAFFIVLLISNFSIIGGSYGNNGVLLGPPLDSLWILIPLNGIELLIINNLLILLIFEFIRRAFYYIVLGKLRPKKG